MVAVVLILVVGPKDLPPMLRAFGRTLKKYRRMANDFKGQFNEALEESELDELRQTVTDAKSYNPLSGVSDAVKEVGAEINEAVEDIKPVKPWTPKPEEISDVARSVGVKKGKAKTATASKSVTKRATTVRKTTTTAKKPAASKPSAKNLAAKKPAVKPAVAKKPAVKNTAAKVTPKPRAAAVKKTTASSGKAKAK